MEIKELNEKLADFPYVSGYTPSQADLVELKKLPDKYSQYVNVSRWAKHLSSFSEAEKKAFPGTPSAATDKKGGDDDDDIDLFGSDDDEEAEKAKAERQKQLDAQKASSKPAVIAKSSIVIDVKVWDDETDLNEVEASVRKIQMDGLLWGGSKKVPLAFGVSKLQIGAVIEDAKVSVDSLTEEIEELELVQSTDIAAFQKV